MTITFQVVFANLTSPVSDLNLPVGVESWFIYDNNLRSYEHIDVFVCRDPFGDDWLTCANSDYNYLKLGSLV